MSSSIIAVRLIAFALTVLASLSLFVDPFAGGEGASLAGVGERVGVSLQADGTRLVRHRCGVTRVPGAPRRICALNFADELVMLGAPPSAVSTDWRGTRVDYLRKELAGATPVPHSLGRWLPSHDAIAAHGPDLILTWSADRHAYDQLSRIAPTVVVRTLGEVLEENGDLDALVRRLEDVAAVTGLEGRAEAAIDRFHRHLDAARATIGDSMEGKTIAFLRARGRQWRLYGKRDQCGGEAVYEALGLEAPPLVEENGVELDPARLVALDADYMIVVADSILASERALGRLERHPLWRRVPAVRSGHVLRTQAFEHWVLSGLAGKMQMIDDVVACLLGEGK